MRQLFLLGLVTAALAGCANNSSTDGQSSTNTGAAPSASGSASGLGHDSFGDPYITDAQGAAVHKGIGERAAFKILGGKADSGSTGQQAGPVLGYDYPVKGTGNPDNLSDTSTIWWQVCIGYGRVLSTQRGKMDALPTFCAENTAN